MVKMQSFEKYSENQEKIFTGKIKGKMKEKCRKKVQSKPRENFLLRKSKGNEGQFFGKNWCFQICNTGQQPKLWDFGQKQCLRAGREN